jgi:putative addiction module component (TIGR02574 family)
MNAMLMKELAKLSIEERRALIDDLWDSIDNELDTPPLSEEVGKLLDERAEALARDPDQKKFTLQEIAARNNVKL